MKNRLFFEHNFSDELFNFAKQEAEHIGFWRLVDENLSKYVSFADEVSQKCIAIIGIGGSSLGVEAIYNFLRPKFEYEKSLIFLDTTDPIQLSTQLEKIDLSATLFFVISKSGTTIESIASLKYLDHILQFSKNNLVVITDQGSPLEKFGLERGSSIFHIPESVGGRYSVLSVVGLLPLASIGVDIQELINGAKEIKSDFLRGDFPEVVSKALFFGENRNTYGMNALFSYSSLLKSFNEWYVQLWGESLGKVRKDGEAIGLTPIGLIGPKDQHSFLQLLMEGKKDKSVTFIKIKDMDSHLSIPVVSLSNLENLDIINGISFEELINLQASSTLEALKNSGVPTDVLELEDISERSIGKLIFYFEILTTLTAEVMEIEPYRQDGVELGKTILKKKLAET
jgi:glucose-6-phosphate isomerase